MQERIRRITAAPHRKRRRATASHSGHSGGPLSRHRVVRLLLLATAVLSAIGMGTVTVTYAAYNGYHDQLPDPGTLAAMEPDLDTHVYARDGTLIAILHNQDYRHEHVSLDQVNHLALAATIDTEDKHFFENRSWDLPRIAKSGWDNLHGGGTTQGASTISEQLAKISFLPAEKSYDRKIKQLLLGNEIEANFSKQQVLEMYLNRIDYGNHAKGIESAAQAYFQVHANGLDLAQASMLAGLPNSPSVYNPLLHGPETDVNPLAKQRQRIVLNAMVSSGDITRVEADAADAEKLVFHQWFEAEPHVAPDYISYLRSYLTDKFGDAYLKPGGWEITTSLDLGRQAIAEKAVHDGIAAVYRDFNARDGALVSMDPRDGEVLAVVGTWDYTNPGVGQLNMATRRLQPGSTIKLFTYTAAIASRQFTMTSPVEDAPLHLGDYSPQDYDRRFHGVCTLATCLGNSLNVPAVRVEQQVGIPYITNLEIAAGLGSLAQPQDRPAPNQWAATLGGLRYGLSPLELADGVSTIASGGIHHDPAPVLKVVDQGIKKTVYLHDPKVEGRRVIPENVAFILSEITSNDHNRLMEFGPNSALTLPDRRVSAKTGTTENFSDNWTVGWTPSAATVVWVGNPSPSCLRSEDRDALAKKGGGNGPDFPYAPQDLARYGLQPLNDHCGHLIGSTGVTGAAPIWHNYMAAALAGTPKDWYPRPPDVIATGGGDDAVFDVANLPVIAPPVFTGCSPAPAPAPILPANSAGRCLPPAPKLPFPRPAPTPIH